MATLDSNRQLVSDLWLDQPDAHERIDERNRSGELSSDDAALMREFTDLGFAKIHLDDSMGLDRRLDADVEQLWEDRPADLAMGLATGGRISFRDASDEDRTVGYRVADPHSHCPTALDLYLRPEIFRVVEMIFDQPAIAFQSLFFQFGSEQALHRDPMFVVTRPPSHLVAAWIALEDITEQSGPLLYAPGSHRMPWFEFHEDDVAVRGDDKEGRQRWAQHRRKLMEDMELEPQILTCRQGDVFIWHGGLLHGGAKVTDPTATRKSFVVHYSTAANYRSRRASMKVRSGGEGQKWVGVQGTTTDVIERDGCRGLDNPLRHIE